MDEYRRLKDKGRDCLREGNAQKAIDYCTRAINEALRLAERLDYSPGFPDTDTQSNTQFLELPVCYANRSLAHLNLKQSDAALADAERAIALAPDWPKARAHTHTRMRTNSL